MATRRSLGSVAIAFVLKQAPGLLHGGSEEENPSVQDADLARGLSAGGGRGAGCS